VQIGDADSDEKPQFASLLKGQSLATLTLEEALKLFEFPRTIGEYEGKDVTVAIGRFGPYVKHDGKFVSIPADIAPSAISLEEAIELINKKRTADANRLIKSFDEDADVQILNGRFGPYIAYQKSNYKIPKTVENAADLTLEQCREIIASQPAKATKKAAKGTTKKASTKKK
jgi:DNA topoisomerase-1